MRDAFRNLRIGAKLSLIPASIIALLLGLGAYGFLLLSDNELRLARLNEGILRQSTTVGDFDQLAWQAQAKLYRLVSVAGNESDAAKIARLSKELIAELQQTGQSFQPVKGAMLAAGVGAERVEAVEKSFVAYQKAAIGVADMADGDAATALGWMTQTERRFGELDTLLDAITKDLTTEKDQSIAAMAGDMDRGRLIFAGVIGVIALLAMSLSVLLGRAISQPIVAMGEAVRRIAEKDYSVLLPALGRRDELGRMAQSVAVLKERSIRADQLAGEQQQIAEANRLRSEHLQNLALAFDANISGILEAVSTANAELQLTASTMSSAAEQSSARAGAVSVAAEQAAANVQTVAAAAEELGASIGEISRQVSRSSDMAQRAVADAERTNSTVRSVANASQEIGKILGLITEIASQTNLLALNATIEAARAGEAGKGFAVVASEVKNLASQTASATKEIEAQIATMRQVTEQAVSGIQSINQTIGEMSQIATNIASAVEEQGASTHEIARNVQQAAAGTDEVSSNIAEVSDAAISTGVAADHVLGAVRQLTKQASALRDTVTDFLASVRAA